MMQKYSDKKLPAIPKAPMPIITVPRFEVKEFAPIYNVIDHESIFKSKIKTVAMGTPFTFEDMNLGWGMILYSTRLPEIGKPDGDKISCKAWLTLNAHDYAQVFIDGKYIGKTDRSKNETTVELPYIEAGQELQILVEGMGRINFGRAIKDYKGIIGQPVINATMHSHLGGIDETKITFTPNRWDCWPIADDYETAIHALEQQKKNPTTQKELNRTVVGRSNRFARKSEDLVFGRGYYRGYFNLKKTGDTFLNFETWGKGQVWVNGHAMGRIWSIGPQQTLYVPGCWLKKGENEIIVLDITGPEETVVWGQDVPELNKLQIEMPPTHRKKGQTLDLSQEKPVMTGTLEPGNGLKFVKFDKPVTGRYFCIEALNSHWNREYCCIAEIYLRDADGKSIPRDSWTVFYADDEDVVTGNKNGTKAFDQQESTYWSTNKGVPFPHHLVIDLQKEQTITGFHLIPRMEEGAPEAIKDYRIFVKSSPFKM